MDIELVKSGEPTSASLEQDIQAMVSAWVKGAPIDSITRLTNRAFIMGHRAMQVSYYKSVLAEQIYLMKIEKDWQYFINTDGGQPFGSWDEFHEKLIGILPISESASWYYQKVVRYAYQVLKVTPGTFADVGGLTTAGKMLEMSKIDGYSRADWGDSVKPATKHFAERLEPYGDTYQEQMQGFFNESVRHDYDDPGAINKPAKELGQLVDESLGKPKIWFTKAFINGVGEVIQWNIVYADGVLERGTLVPEGPMPNAVYHTLIRYLKIPERNDNG
jgi:hypothetical protein